MSAADALRMSAIRRSEYFWLEKLKRPPLPSGSEISGCKNVGARNSGYEMSVHGILPRVDWAMLRKRGSSACVRCRDPSPGWHGVRKVIRINSIRISQEEKAAQCYPAQLHPNDSIYYPDMLSGWKTLTKVSERALLQPTFRRSQMVCPYACSDIFTMDSKELSSIYGLLWW